MRSAGARIGGLAGALGAIVIGAGLAMMPALPGPDVSAPDVFTYFLDGDRSVDAPAALVGIGLILALVLFATLRNIAGPEHGRTAASIMLALAQVAVVLQAAALGLVIALTRHAEAADPATARSLLDLSDVLAAFSGAAFAFALLAAARVVRRSHQALPVRFAEAAIVAAACCALWTVRLFTDAGAFASDSFLGSELGWLALAAWLLAAGLWMGSGRLDQSDAGVEREPEAIVPSRRAERRARFDPAARAAVRLGRPSTPPPPPPPPTETEPPKNTRSPEAEGAEEAAADPPPEDDDKPTDEDQ